MRHLAIECSAIAGSVSLLDGAREIRSLTLDSKTGSVQGLAILVKETLFSGGVVTDPPLLISVTAGPGSFTGLRVGLATAKSLAFAWNIPVVAVDTLHAIALRAAGEFASEQKSYRLVSVMNAYRKQVFVAGWQVNLDGRMIWRKCSQVVDANRWMADPWESQSDFDAPQDAAEPFIDSKSIRVSGPGLRNYSPNEIACCELVPGEMWEPRSIEVGQIGWEKFLRGEVSSANSLAANYIRSSAAEEKRRV